MCPRGLRSQAGGMATTTTQDTRDRLFTRGFVLLSLGELAYLVSDGMAIYLIPVYAAGPVGAGQSGAGLAFGAFALSALVLRPWAGRFADTRGRRPLLVGGALVAAVALLLTAQVAGLAGLVGLRLLAGVGEAAVFTATFAAIADLAPPNRLGEALSYNSLALYVGLAAGPLIGELVVDHGGFPAGWVIAAVFATTAAAIYASVPESGALDPSAASSPSIHRRSLPVALGFLASIVAMGGFLAFAALRADGLGMMRTSLPLVVYGTTVVVGRLTVAKLVDRVPPLRLGCTALVAMAAGLGVAAVAGTPAWLLVGAFLLGVGVTFSTPAFFAAIFSAAGQSERGAASAMASAALDLGLGGGPILLGFVAETMGIPWAFAVGAGVALAGAAWTLTLGMARTRSGPRPASVT